MKKSIRTRYGEAVLLGSNPRTMRDSAFDRLADSMEARPMFLGANRIVVWRCPETLDVGEGEKCPFRGQEGKLVVIAGNQRVKVLLAKGFGEIRDEWVCEAKDDEGEWWGWRDAEMFVNLSNSPEGVSGEFDYKSLLENFDEGRMRMSGIDFSNFAEALSSGVMKGDLEAEAVKELEEGEHGEANPELEQFISEREKTRADLKEIDDTGFHLLLVFGDFRQKCEFVSKAGLVGKGGMVAVDGTEYVDLVFESCAQKEEFVAKVGLSELKDGNPDGECASEVLWGKFCDGRALAKKMGIELAESGLHFRKRIVDTRLRDMAMTDEPPQKTVEETEEAIYAELRAEREALGMDSGRGAKGNRE